MYTKNRICLQLIHLWMFIEGEGERGLTEERVKDLENLEKSLFIQELKQLRYN